MRPNKWIRIGHRPARQANGVFVCLNVVLFFPGRDSKQDSTETCILELLGSAVYERENMLTKKNNSDFNMDGTLAAAATTLVPNRDASTSTSTSTDGTNPSNRKNNRNKNRNRKSRQQQQQNTDSQRDNTIPQPALNRRNRNRQRKGNEGNSSLLKENAENNKNSNNKSGRPGRRKRYPWRRHIPQGTVDPITLDPLVALPYPPFALMATGPYQPVPEWPIPEKEDRHGKNANNVLSNETEQDRAKRILQEQWGDRAVTTQEKKETEGPEESSGRRHYHLYDGRALAYYVVSQLQFIDPLNRRDLTREELVNLDNYLERHGFARGNVVQAYDAKGVTLSTAGATGNTAAGRAEILRQEAEGLLNALFGGSNSNNNHRAGSTSSLQQLYAASNQREQQQQQQRNHSPHSFAEQTDEDIYGDDGGIVIIDDDIHPGLRGGGELPHNNRNDDADDGAALDPLASSATSLAPPGTFWSASHITSRYNPSGRAQNFPALPSRPTKRPTRLELLRPSHRRVGPESSQWPRNRGFPRQQPSLRHQIAI